MGSATLPSSPHAAALPAPAVLDAARAAEHAPVSVGSPSSFPPSLSGERDRALDFLRGWAVVWMTASHVAPKSKLGALLHLPLWISALEWFTIVSGVVLGMRARRAVATGASARFRRSVWARAGTLYKLHVPLVLAVVAIHEASGRLDVPSVRELGGWLSALVLTATLSIQPPDYLNILPLYIVMFLVAPLAIALMARGASWLVALVSLSLWAVAQHAPDFVPFPLLPYGPQVFSITAWQLMFMVGLLSGYHRAGALGALWQRHRRWLLPLVLGFTLLVFVYAQLQRHVLLPLGLDLPWQLSWLFEKKLWAPGRALYTLGLTIAAHTALVALTRYAEAASTSFARASDKLISTVELLGRRSFSWFLLHLVVALAAAAFHLSAQPQWIQELSLVASLLVLFEIVRRDRLVAYLPR